MKYSKQLTGGVNLVRLLCIFGILLLLSSIRALAVNPKTPRVTFNDANLRVVGSVKSLFVRDNYTSCIFKSIEKAELNLKLNLGEDYNYGKQAFSTNVTLLVSGYTANPDGSNGTLRFTETITLKIDPSKPEELYIKDFTALHGNTDNIDVKVSAYGRNEVVAGDIRVEAFYTETFKTYVGWLTAASISLTPVTGSPNPVTFKWRLPCPDVQDYEFQLLRLYNESTPVASDRNLSARIDWSKALSIETLSKDTSLTLTVAEGTGYYIWRVRPIGTYYEGGITNNGNWGPWSTAPIDGTVVTYTGSSALPTYAFYFEQFDNNKNWIYSRTFTGDSKISETIKFANGLNQVKQSQQRLQSQDSTWVSQTVYDFSGRPAVSSMKAPVSSRALSYINQFMQNGGNLYNSGHFDEDANFKNPLPVTSGNLNAYYSDSNPDLRIPDAEGYPLQRTLYYGDGTTRAREISGLGEALRVKPDLANCHTSKIYYSSVANQELIRMFGDEAPADTSVFKIISLDPNKTAHVVYVQSKDTLATCLAVSSNTALDSLPSRAGSLTSITDTLRANLSCGENCLESRKQLSFTMETALTLNYRITPNNVEELCNRTCSTCDYKIYFIITKTDERDPSFPRVDSLIVPASVCTSRNFAWSRTYTLPPGSYQISKRVQGNTLNNNSISASDPLGKTFIEQRTDSLKAAISAQFTESTSAILDYLNRADLNGLYSYLKVDDATTSGNVDVEAGCCNISIPIIRCEAITCPAEGDFEAYFRSHVPDSLSGVAGGRLRFLPDYAPGQFNQLIDNMIHDPVDPYACDSLWRCWTGLTNSYVLTVASLTAGPTLPDAPGYRPVYDLLDNFLTCVGRRFRGISNRDFGDFSSPGYLSHAYAYIHYNVSAPNINCESTLSGTLGGAVDWSRSYSYDTWNSFYHCLDANAAAVGTSITPPNVDSLIQRCNTVCLARLPGFVQSIERLYADAGYTKILNLGYVDKEGKDTITFDAIYCKAHKLVEECMRGCKLSEIKDEKGLLISVGTKEEIERVRQSMTYSYKLSLPQEGKCEKDFELVEGGEISFNLNLQQLNNAMNRYRYVQGDYVYYYIDSVFRRSLYDNNALRYCLPERIVLTRYEKPKGFYIKGCTLLFKYYTSTQQIAQRVICDNVCNRKTKCAAICFKWVKPETGDPVVIRHRSCEEITAMHIRDLILAQKEACMALQVSQLRTQYRNQCLAFGTLHDLFTLQYNLGYYHFTLFYFDRIGNLVRTVPPEGTDLSSSSRANHPNHKLVSEYYYNSLKQLVKQKTPDNGTLSYYYNYKGLLRFTQNDKQSVMGTFTFKKYDYLNRIIESGESKQNAATFMSFANNNNFPDARALKWEVDSLIYTQRAAIARSQRFLRNKISAMGNYEGGSTYFSYDSRGNIEWIAQNIPGIGVKYIDYEYDPITAKVTKVKYNEGSSDQFYHKFTYDADKRLKIVETSKDGRIWEKDARYNYYADGALSRILLGEDKLQGMDYLYTVQGWLKAINHPSLNQIKDPAQDGLANNVGKDAFAIGLGYFTGDFIRTGSPFSASDPATLPLERNLYNGNISSWSSQLMANPAAPLQYEQLTALKLRYDEIGRLTSSAFHYFNSVWNNTSDYATQYAYDANGNIKSLLRNGYSAYNLQMDNLTYHYNPSTNRLNYISDVISSANYSDDLDNQSLGNYAYDEVGNLTRDVKDGIDYITWRADGKVRQINKSNGDKILFTYNASGQRIIKGYFTASGTVTRTFYILDNHGNIISAYTGEKIAGRDSIYQAEVPIYGSNRIGIFKPLKWKNANARWLNTREYELKDHLGNVNATISDIKLSKVTVTISPPGVIIGNYKADLLFSNHYFPFGAVMPGRSYTPSSAYRYGYNGMEKDNEVKGAGNSYTTEFRQYDPRVGRWLSVDPKITKYPGWNPYNFTLNNPISLTDIYGDEIDLSPGIREEAGEIMANRQSVTLDIISEERQITGLDLILDDRGRLTYNTVNGAPVILRDGNGREIGSPVARDILRRMIDDPRVIRVHYDPNEAYSYVNPSNPYDVHISRTEINFIRRALTGAGINPLTLSYGFALLHEMHHTPLGSPGGLLDDPPVGSDRAGDVEDMLNPARDQLGLQRRYRYHPRGSSIPSMFRRPVTPTPTPPVPDPPRRSWGCSVSTPGL